MPTSSWHFLDGPKRPSTRASPTSCLSISSAAFSGRQRSHTTGNPVPLGQSGGRCGEGSRATPRGPGGLSEDEGERPRKSGDRVLNHPFDEILEFKKGRSNSVRLSNPWRTLIEQLNLRLRQKGRVECRPSPTRSTCQGSDPRDGVALDSRVKARHADGPQFGPEQKNRQKAKRCPL